MRILIQRSVRFRHKVRHLIYVRGTITYSSSGDRRKIVIEIVIGGRHCSRTLSKDSDLSWVVIPATEKDEDK